MVPPSLMGLPLIVAVVEVAEEVDEAVVEEDVEDEEAVMPTVHASNVVYLDIELPSVLTTAVVRVLPLLVLVVDAVAVEAEVEEDEEEEEEGKEEELLQRLIRKPVRLHQQ